jgi:hypothetical protein
VLADETLPPERQLGTLRMEPGALRDRCRVIYEIACDCLRDVLGKSKEAMESAEYAQDPVTGLPVTNRAQRNDRTLVLTFAQLMKALRERLDKEKIDQGHDALVCRAMESYQVCAQVSCFNPGMLEGLGRDTGDLALKLLYGGPDASREEVTAVFQRRLSAVSALVQSMHDFDIPLIKGRAGSAPGLMSDANASEVYRRAAGDYSESNVCALIRSMGDYDVPLGREYMVRTCRGAAGLEPRQLEENPDPNRPLPRVTRPSFSL